MNRSDLKIFVSLFMAGCLLILVSINSSVYGQKPVKRTPLSAEAQQKLLKSRTPSGAMLGSFDSMCSLLFAVQDIAIHTDSHDVNDTNLNTIFPPFYQPTWQEYFDEIARQTQSTWKYDATRDYWVFSKPAMPVTFTVTVAEGWRPHDEGSYVGYTPPTAPVGMDIYMLGNYSSDTPDQTLFTRVRDALALLFAGNFKKDVTVKDMQKVTIDGVEALYFQSPAPRPGTIWRQWVLVKDGHAYAIVSSLNAEDKKLLADVEAMVPTFKVKAKE